jgi:hypothetical protein
VRPRDETLVLHSPKLFCKVSIFGSRPCFLCQASRYLESKEHPRKIHHTPTIISHEHSLRSKMADNGTAPSGATDAVLKPSDPVPEGAMPVKGLDFNDFKNVDITAAELVANMAQMGFQASSIGQAAKIVDGMVCNCVFSFILFAG